MHKTIDAPPTSWFQSVCEDISDGIACVCPVSQKFIWCNEAYARLVGYSIEEMLDKTWKDITILDDMGSDVREFDKVIAGRQLSYTMQKQYIARLGHRIPVRLTVYRHPKAGDLVCLTAHVRSIPVTQAALDELRSDLSRQIDDKIEAAFVEFRPIIDIWKKAKVMLPIVIFVCSWLLPKIVEMIWSNMFPVPLP